MTGRAVLRLLGSVCVVLAAAVVAVSMYAIREGRRADAARRDTQAARALATASLAEVDRAPELALLLALEACRRACDSPAEESYETRHSLVTALQRSARLQSVLHNGGRLTTALAFSPNGRWLAVRSMRYVEDESTGISIWDLERGIKHGKPLHVGFQGEMVFTPDGLLSVLDGGVRVFDVERTTEVGGPLHFGPFDEEVYLVDLSPDGKLLAVTTTSGFNLFDVGTGARVEGFPQSRFSGGAFSPDSRSLIAYIGPYQRSAAVWDLERGVEKARLPFQLPFRIAPIEFSPDGRTLAFGTAGGIRLWDLARNAPARAPLRVRGDIIDLAFDPDGDRLAAVTHGGAVSIWDRRTGRSRAHASVGGTVPIFSSGDDTAPLSFGPDGRTLAASPHRRATARSASGTSRRNIRSSETESATELGRSCAAYRRSPSAPMPRRSPQARRMGAYVVAASAAAPSTRK